jgi:hypothetical protein
MDKVLRRLCQLLANEQLFESSQACLASDITFHKNIVGRALRDGRDRNYVQESEFCA